MNQETLQKTIKTFENELRDLKNVQGAIHSVAGYFKSYRVSSALQNQTLRLQFEDGDGPILCYCPGSAFQVPFKIQNGTQDYFFRFLFAGTYTFFSTRPIISITNVS